MDSLSPNCWSPILTLKDLSTRPAANDVGWFGALSPSPDSFKHRRKTLWFLLCKNKRSLALRRPKCKVLGFKSADGFNDLWPALGTFFDAIKFQSVVVWHWWMPTCHQSPYYQKKKCWAAISDAGPAVSECSSGVDFNYYVTSQHYPSYQYFLAFY